jgi:hypothetical protein
MLNNIFTVLLDTLPLSFEAQHNFWLQNMQPISQRYTSKQNSFLPVIHPSQIVLLPVNQVIYLLSKRYGGETLQQCMQFENNVQSPVALHTNAKWMQQNCMVGVNVRTIGSFWKLVKYALSLPNRQSAIHILPIWECGVVASLYGKASWYLNNEFFDDELYRAFPYLNTVEKQLKVCVNLLHLMGKTVGLDVVPHTDRYAEIVLANPDYFEWLQRKDLTIVDHSITLIEKVKDCILDFLAENPAASNHYFPRTKEKFFDNEVFSETLRIQVLFGAKTDYENRHKRRVALIDKLFALGYEPCPATMGPPYRALLVDPSPSATTTDTSGKVWRDYTFENKTVMSRAFGPLTRYRLFESKDDNINWELDFEKPRHKVYDYIAQHYAEVVAAYNFDFMRGDMSHVQMNPNVVYDINDPYYDIHKYVKNYIRKDRPYFGYFAESFLEKDDFMAYGNEAKHLEASECEVALGNLQSFGLYEPEHWKIFVQYLQIASGQVFKPSLTIFTADKDDPRFDSSFEQGAVLRLFLAYFFTKLPSYTALGFEQRDSHKKPWPNEYYTKLYVFQEKVGPKATNGPYRWGQNGHLFAVLQQINGLSDLLFIHNASPVFKLISTKQEIEQQLRIEWQLVFNENEKYTFVGNLFEKIWQPINYKNAEIIFEYNELPSKKGSLARFGVMCLKL